MQKALIFRALVGIKRPKPRVQGISVVLPKLYLGGRSGGCALHTIHGYQEKHSRLARLERFAILLVFLFLRLAVSATGSARLRHLVPHLISLAKRPWVQIHTTFSNKTKTDKTQSPIRFSGRSGGIWSVKNTPINPVESTNLGIKTLFRRRHADGKNAQIL